MHQPKRAPEHTRSRHAPRTAWRIPPQRIPGALAVAAVAALILICEPLGRAAEADIAAWIAQHLTLRTGVIDIDGIPHLAVSRGRVWRGTGLHTAQTATFWVGVATIALTAALLWRRTNPTKLALLGIAAITVIVTASQLRLLANAAALHAGTAVNSATDAVGAVVAATTTLVATATTILLSLRRGRPRRRAHGRHSWTEPNARSAPRTLQPAPSSTAPGSASTENPATAPSNPAEQPLRARPTD